ncbi:unnamed protein product [Gulo gulo]|uniref:Uncharacterized protein n=1 Tax=Gulo gulo TaxID=48420 RepID=A0A9X9LMV4_GULGU|nr:unnamed protein product [Gulo gulo]
MLGFLRAVLMSLRSRGSGPSFRRASWKAGAAPPRAGHGVWRALGPSRCNPQSYYCWSACPGWRSHTGTAAWNPTPAPETHS